MGAYLNASSHGLPSTRTVQRVIDHLKLEQEIGPVAARESVEGELLSVRANAADLIGSVASDLGFSFTTFSAWRAVVDCLDLSGKRVLVAPHEWGENTRLLFSVARDHGFEVEVLPQLDLSSPDLAPWADRFDHDIEAIFVPMVTSVQGLRYPVKAIGELDRPDNCRLIVDAAQALGQIDIDVSTLRCDALVATCRKWLRGPRGVSLFWLNRSAFPGANIKDVEPLDANIALHLALGNAFSEIHANSVEDIGIQIRRLTSYVMQRADACGLQTLGNLAPQTGAVCLSIPVEKAAALRSHLAVANFHVKWPDAVSDEPYSQHQLLQGKAMRIAPHIYNSDVEIDALFDCVQHIL